MRKLKNDVMRLRLLDSEKDAFQKAAEQSGLSLSAWVRERLRRIARIELKSIGKIPKW
jgi:hypothetical protein